MKDYLRDYCTEAFRFYASNGKTAEEYKNEIYNKALEEYTRHEEKGSGISCPTEAAIIAAENKVIEMQAEIKDVEAVEMTMAEIASECRSHDIGQAVKIVYFKDPDKELKPGDISSRVHVAELNIPASERSVYYYLKKARTLFAEHRGLRTGNKKTSESLQ